MVCQHDTPNPTKRYSFFSLHLRAHCHHHSLLPAACPWELLQWKRGDPVIDGLQYSLTAGHCLLLRQLQCLCSGPSSVESKAGVTHVQPRHHRCVSRDRIRASIMQQQQPGAEGAVMKPSEPAEDEQHQQKPGLEGAVMKPSKPAEDEQHQQKPGLEGAVMKPSEPAEDEQQQEEAERRRLYQAWKGNNVRKPQHELLLSSSLLRYQFQMVRQLFKQRLPETDPESTDRATKPNQLCRYSCAAGGSCSGPTPRPSCSRHSSSSPRPSSSATR
jgi:hypothetical protein